jgi:hypothetical protein
MALRGKYLYTILFEVGAASSRTSNGSEDQHGWRLIASWVPVAD